MSQNMRASLPSCFGLHGRRQKVFGSGRATMSLSSIRAKPSIEEPSNPIPVSSASASSERVMESPFRRPRTSVNHSLMNRTLCSLTSLSISVFESDMAFLLSLGTLSAGQ